VKKKKNGIVLSSSAPLGLDRWLDFSVYHAGGMDTLTGATRWQVSSEDEEDYMAEDLFLVRDHLGSVVMTLKAQKTCTMWMEPPGPGEGGPECGAWAYVLNPIETFEYDPYGQPTAHVPGSEDTPSGAGYLALKTAGAFAMSGEKSGYMLLDRNDIGRPNGTPGNTWVRNGAVPAAQSHYGWNYLFTARPWDSDVRQYYIRNRWYDPQQGRWTAVDPIGYRGGLNQYAYCGGNPINAVDPMGLAVLVFGVCTQPECNIPHTGFNIQWDDPNKYGKNLQFDYDHTIFNAIDGNDAFSNRGGPGQADRTEAELILEYGFRISDEAVWKAVTETKKRFKKTTEEGVLYEYRLCDQNCNTTTAYFIQIALITESFLETSKNGMWINHNVMKPYSYLVAANSLNYNLSLPTSYMTNGEDENMFVSEESYYHKMGVPENHREAIAKGDRIDLGSQIYKWFLKWQEAGVLQGAWREGVPE